MTELTKPTDGGSVFGDVADISILQKALVDNELSNVKMVGTVVNGELQKKVPIREIKALIKLEAEQNRIRCPECERYTAESEQQLQRHILRVHRGENPFKCYMCEYSTYNKAVFEEHVRVHQGIKPFKCSQCDYASASKKNAKKHEAIHRPDNPLRCKVCGFISRHPKALQSHLTTVHKNNDNVEETLICAVCKHTFSSEKNYLSHKKYLRSCILCKFKTCVKKTFLNHMDVKHGETKSDGNSFVLFRCALCKWSSNVKPRILLHLIHHPKQKVCKEIDISILRKMQIMK